MLSRNGALPSSQPEVVPPHQSPANPGLRGSSSPAPAGARQDGYVSPRPLEHRLGPSLPPQAQPSQQPQRRQQQHGFNAPHPPLSPFLPFQEYHSGFSDEDVGAPYTPKQHRRQSSFPNLLPLSFRSRTPSPSRKSSVLSDQMPLTGDGRGTGRGGSPRGGFAGWLSSTAAASALGMTPSPVSRPPTEGASPLDVTPDTTPTRLRRSLTGVSVPEPSTTPKSTVTTTASRFMSAISSRFTPAPSSPMLDDELCNLDIEAALFPPMSPLSDRDAFSPAAFKNLQSNAVGLLTKMQSAYRERVVALRELEAERSAHRDEIEEAETRAQHLKMQLEGMSRKAQEHEQAMRQLMEELAAEKKLRAEERLAAGGDKASTVMSEGSMVSEDLGVDEEHRRRKWRKSGSTVKSELTGFDTDEESAESESVFSRCRSPTIPVHSAFDGVGGGNPASIDGAAPSPHLPRNNSSSLAVPSSSSSSSSSNSKPRGAGQPQMSALQKIIRGISGEAEESPNGCANCKGQDASVAWDTVSLLRDENKHLKHRVGSLEIAVEGALDLVNGIGL
ncbi:hypothetical protein B0T19DRAFT_117537 [Cercophora scortea]|uniref:Uncharacterized protein n=1 Tax=Cercophora scortea TaxID=314031 RepID=A0AAE0IYA2_9PEZI|nr:hypothetical protein B0T19DRAFT_117537 [Cercophora scortea]